MILCYFLSSSHSLVFEAFGHSCLLVDPPTIESSVSYYRYGNVHINTKYLKWSYLIVASKFTGLFILLLWCALFVILIFIPLHSWWCLLIFWIIYLFGSNYLCFCFFKRRLTNNYISYFVRLTKVIRCTPRSHLLELLVFLLLVSSNQLFQ